MARDEFQMYPPGDMLPPDPGQMGGTDEIFFQNDMVKATKEILEDKIVDESLKDFPLWSINSKTLKLTFLDGAGAESLRNLFEAEVCRLMRSIPPCVQDSKLYLTVGEARIIFNCNLQRSVGTNNREKMNERIALLSQVKQIIRTGSGGGQQEGASWFQKLTGRR